MESVILETSVGQITLELYWKHAPKTCQNFKTLASRGYYNDTVFHRIIPDFMIQGGDPTGTGRGGSSIYGGKFNDEFSDLKHVGAGILSMANSGPNTNGSQFFITLAPTPWLDNKHTIFGRVSGGMEIVKRMGKVATDPSDRPKQDIVIRSTKVLEIERKRKEITEKTKNVASKYMKRGDLESVQNAVSEPKLEKLVAAKKPPANPDVVLPEKEVISQLRARGAPICLFGETLADRCARLKSLGPLREETGGQRNELLSVMKSTNKSLEMDLLAGVVDNNQSQEKLKLEKELEKIDTTIISTKLMEKDPEKNRYLVGAYLKRLVLVWERVLNERSDEEKRSPQGKLATTNRIQSTQHLEPFFLRLKNNSLELDVMARVSDICRYMQDREYIKANDAYLRMSIGNAPWPIGVTAVCMHERPADDKITESKVAHVLNDETQRKWIQGIKRLMTFAQLIWPPDDLSKAIG